ncbi:MAG: transcriptional repressor [Prevotellaceae bacterium]|jgi:Fe2+ or Zn2+ uptake regulation protein|nr:transcriptional repressor [Prevotellaceae bacterium]
MNSTQQYLTIHGIKPSVQRLAIMEYLLKHRTHPTADEIYTVLLPDMPTLSKTTVYNTLKLFVQHGVALYVDIDERNARFDGEMKTHAHFRCKKCGCIIDVPLPDMQSLLPDRPDFFIDEAYINVKGLCKACKL